jgi:hypothetical protein
MAEKETKQVMSRLIRNALAGAIIAAVPVTSTLAAVRPSAAVPMVTSVAVAAQDPVVERRSNIAAGLPVLAFAAAMAVLIIIQLTEDDDEVSLTRG